MWLGQSRSLQNGKQEWEEAEKEGTPWETVVDVLTFHLTWFTTEERQEKHHRELFIY